MAGRGCRGVSISAPAELALALMLALWTGQRQGDLLRLPWSAYDGAHIRLQQSRPGDGSLSQLGTSACTARPNRRRGPLILTNTRGKPWTSDGFPIVVGQGMRNAKIARSNVPRLARLCGRAACARRRDRAADRDLHRPQSRGRGTILDATISAATRSSPRSRS